MRNKLARRAALAGAFLAPVAAVLPATPAAAATTDAGGGGVNMQCVFVVTSNITPGITPTLTVSTFDSGGLTGTATCTGTVNGRRVTGPGVVGLHATETASCTVLYGTGYFAVRVPIAGGIALVIGSYVSQGGITGDMQGTAQVLSIDAGDCYNTPVTRVTTQSNVHVGPVTTS
ncbi:hypothetical protein ABZS66_32400 [Dactylosporangium sp. NPDC005572]|uniref:hypothetical protein n=1 Tax=Dactylosporangium sp. NPDC005572 TaxID=3156889 RepID=UPI0033BE758E